MPHSQGTAERGPWGRVLVSCIILPPGNSAGRGLVDPEMVGDFGECVGSGPVGFGDGLVSVGGCSGNPRKTPG